MKQPEGGVWLDTSNWEQSDSEEKKAVPKAWTIYLGPVRLSVHRHLHYGPTAWLISVVPTFWTMTQADSKDVEEVKKEAVEMLKGTLGAVLTRIHKFEKTDGK